MSENWDGKEPIILRIVFKDTEDSLKGLQELVGLWKGKYASTDVLSKKRAELVLAFGHWGGIHNREFVVALENCTLATFAHCVGKSLEEFELI